MKFFIDPESKKIFAYDDDAESFIDAAIDGGLIDCGRLPVPGETWDLSNGKWVVDSANVAELLAAARLVQSLAIDTACSLAIMGGFSSTALGAPHIYPTKLTDQQNLSSSVLASMYPNLPANWVTPFWCKDSSGLWSWSDHTASQIQEVGSDMKAAILACMSKNATLQAKILAAVDVNAVYAISWSQS